MEPVLIGIAVLLLIGLILLARTRKATAQKEAEWSKKAADRAQNSSKDSVTR